MAETEASLRKTAWHWPRMLHPTMEHQATEPRAAYYGHYQICQTTARGNTAAILFTPTEYNPGHADIRLTLEETSRTGTPGSSTTSLADTLGSLTSATVVYFLPYIPMDQTTDRGR